MSKKPRPKKVANRAKKRQERQKQEKVVVYQPVDIEWRTSGQKRAWDLLSSHDVTFLLGAAGSGKTFLAMAYAINAILGQQQSNIILTRPIVDAGEKLGFLPGTFGDKVNPYMQPLFDTMDALLGKFSAKREVINKAVSLAPLCYMRGRTFNDAVCILDEAQNATYTQLKLFLSRFGRNTKVIITGDLHQSDLPFSPAPLGEVVEKLKGTPGISALQFTHGDVVRHPLVSAILKKL